MSAMFGEEQGIAKPRVTTLHPFFLLAGKNTTKKKKISKLLRGIFLLPGFYFHFLEPSLDGERVSLSSARRGDPQSSLREVEHS